jgi:peptidoglycan/LPS O-acetylase OafA/YrhL
VVLYHLRQSLADLLPAGVIAVLGTGYLAVDLFFLLSGFVMWLNYGERVAVGGMRETLGFWWRRFARVWPLHTVILTVLLAFALVLRATGRDGSGYPLVELPLHFMLVQNWGFTAELSWNHPAWSISTEAAAYLLFPVMVLGLTRKRLEPAGCLALLALLAAALHGLFAANGHASLTEAIPQLGLWRCLAQFAMGMVLCLLWERWRGRAGVAAGAFVVAALFFAGPWLRVPETACLPLGFAALLLALALDRGPIAGFLGSRGPRWLGDVSYATYLAHVPLLVLVKLLFVDENLQLSWMDLALYVAALLALSAALYSWLEKPAQSWLRRRPPFFGRRKTA